MFRNLSQQYQLDLDKHFLKQFNKSTLNLRIDTQRSQQQIKQVTHKIQKKIKSQLTELSEQNDLIEKFKNIKCYVRSRSSQSKIEGFLRKREQQIFLSLPYHTIKQHKRNFIKKLWRKFFIAITYLIRYMKDIKENIKRIQLSKQFTLVTPRMSFDSTRRRRRNAGSQLKLSTFGQFIEQNEKQEEMNTKRLEEDKYKKNPVYIQLKYNDVRICRLLRQRVNSERFTAPESPIKQKQTNNICKLPPLIQMNKRLLRIYSNVGK